MGSSASSDSSAQTWESDLWESEAGLFSVPAGFTCFMPGNRQTRSACWSFHWGKQVYRGKDAKLGCFARSTLPVEQHHIRPLTVFRQVQNIFFHRHATCSDRVHNNQNPPTFERCWQSDLTTARAGHHSMPLSQWQALWGFSFYHCEDVFARGQQSNDEDRTGGERQPDTNIAA